MPACLAGIRGVCRETGRPRTVITGTAESDHTGTWLLKERLVLMLRKTVTENGRVQGMAASDPRITVYRGIPFAAPPVGQLRWRAPQPAENWEGTRICNVFGPPSMQELPGEKPGFYTKEFYTQPESEMSEDCLYLNVWTPADKADEKLPVMVWIFGGGMSVGYTSEMEFNGERLARRGVIVVSVNYRLNSFGFLAHPELTAEGAQNGESGTNFGLLDQNAGIRWVKRNIAYFGGDPDNITVFGQSAGGRCTWMHIASPQNKGLFRRAIVQSGGLGGGITRYPDRENAEQSGIRFLEHLGVKSIAEARQMSAEELRDKTDTFTGYRWGPVIDYQYLTMSPLAAVYTGAANQVDLLVGSTMRDPDGFRMGNDVDGFLARAEKMYGEQYPEFKRLAAIDSAEKLQAYYETAAFSIFERGNAFAARQYAKQGRNPVYMYRFNPSIPGDDAGAFHSSDLWFVFETLANCWRPFQGKHYDLARKMCNYWANFARSGDPNGPDNDGIMMPEWKPCGANEWHTLFLCDEIWAEDRAPDALMEFEIKLLEAQARKEATGNE